jgi:hypothetical protein
MEPQAGQIWFDRANEKYVLIKEVLHSSYTIDYEYMHNNKATWCDLSLFNLSFTFVSG